MLQKVYVNVRNIFPCIVMYGVDSPSMCLAVLDSGVKVSTYGGSVGHCEKKVYVNVCLILNGYRGGAV